MKKIMAVCVVLGAAFVLSGCGKAKPVDNGGSPAGTSATQEQTTSGEAQETGEKQGLLQKLLSKGAMKCTVEQDGETVTILTNGTKAKIEGMGMPNPKDPTGAKEKGYMISDDTWAYIWSGKEGMKFNIKEMEANTNPVPGEIEDPSEKSSDWKNIVKQMETSGAKYDCSAAVVSDSDFTPPADVVFQDMGEFFKQMQDMGSKMKDVKVPDVNIPQMQK
jgi:hypothetical protein